MSSDMGERELWRAYNYIRDTTGSYFVCVRGSYIHVYVYKFVCMCVSMVRHYMFFGVRIDLTWIEVTPSKQVTSVRVKMKILHGRP